MPDPPTGRGGWGWYATATSFFSLFPPIPPRQLDTPLPHESQDGDTAIETDDNVRATPVGPVLPKKYPQKKHAANGHGREEGESFLRCFVSSPEGENGSPLSPRPSIPSSVQAENALRQNALKGDAPPLKDDLPIGVLGNDDINHRSLASEPIVTRNIRGSYRVFIHQQDSRSA